MSLKEESEMQSVIIHGAILTTASGRVLKGSNTESVLKAINAECKKTEIIEQARKMATALTKELDTQKNTPNIDYLFSSMTKSNKKQIFNWLLTIAKTINDAESFSPEDTYHLSAHLLMILEEIIDGHC